MRLIEDGDEDEAHDPCTYKNLETGKRLYIDREVAWSCLLFKRTVKREGSGFVVPCIIMTAGISKLFSPIA